MKTIQFLNRLLILAVILIATACSDDDETVLVPTSEDAVFTYTFDSENPNKVNFIADPAVETWYTHWSFGDNSSAEGFEASKIYLKKGDYDVRFKVFTEGGSAESIQTIVINEDFQGPNIIKNGEFNDNQFWTVFPISDGVNVSLENSEASWTGGNWGQAGIYQPIQVLANNQYQISMDIKGGPLSDSWFEVYLGLEQPVAGTDYSDGGIRLGLNTWDGCGGEPFEGELTEISCVGTGATFEMPNAGTVYLVIKGGGASYGDAGVTIDNVAVRSLESSEVLEPPVETPSANFTSEISDLEVTFTNTSSNATSYSWDFGDETGTSTDENPTYNYAEPGTYTVSLTVSNDSESVEYTQEITVNNGEPAPTAGFNVETTGLSAAFSNTSTNASSYSWDFGDSTGTSTVENPNYTYAQSGTYTVVLTASNGTESVQYSEEVTVEEDTVEPMADFTVETTELMATFTNTSTNATSYTWDFGDNTGTSTNENPTYTYASEGTYTVTLTAINGDQSVQYTSDVTLTAATSSNLLANGSFDDDSEWTIINHYEAANTNGLVTIADGVTKFDETTNTDWKHMGIYTSVYLEPGTYQFDMEMSYTDISDIWGEVYIGTAQPVEGSDYSGDQQVMLAYNAWDCPDIKTYSGLATESGCDSAENPGQFEISTAGTYYLLFRTGGATYGADGIIIDNISLVPVN